MTLDLIPASAYTLDVLTELYNRARDDYMVRMPMTPERLSAYNTRHNVDMSASLVAELNGELAGLALLGLRGPRAWITRMGVLGGARRAGVGGALAEGVLSNARASGSTEVQLEVIHENGIALRLFKAAGFAPMRHLLVFERPAGAPTVPGPMPDRLLSTPEARDMLDRFGIGYAPSWIEETPSLRRARRLGGLALDDAAMIFGDDGGVLAPLALCNADDLTGPALLAALHTQIPDRPVLKENVPEGDQQAAWFGTAGYQLSFTRIELRRAL